MFSIPHIDLLSQVGSIIATGATIYRIAFKRVEILEKAFNDEMEKIREHLSQIEKTIAVNSALIDQLIKRSDNDGRKNRH